MKRESKPVITLAGGYLWLGGDDYACELSEVTSRAKIGWRWFSAAELRAIADWLDQWEGATLLSEVTE